jgi:hypothetical protein
MKLRKFYEFTPVLGISFWDSSKAPFSSCVWENKSKDLFGEEHFQTIGKPLVKFSTHKMLKGRKK